MSKETMSNVSSSDENEDSLADILESEPLYHILGEFLKTPDDSGSSKNITTVLEDICKELRLIRIALTATPQQK